MRRRQSPSVFRLLLPVRDLRAARRFYERLLGLHGRAVGGGRVYFDCGTVIVGILDVSSEKRSRRPSVSEAVYFAVPDLERIHRRAARLGCLSRELLHDDPASPLGEVVVRPWGERSFYADDPWGNALCFVDSRTLFTGTHQQVQALRNRP